MGHKFNHASLSSLTVLVKVTAVILQNISHSTSTTGSDNVSSFFSVKLSASITEAAHCSTDAIANQLLGEESAELYS
jgi:hypothetical protein